MGGTRLLQRHKKKLTCRIRGKQTKARENNKDFMRSYKFRIYPSKAQEKELRHHLWVSKELWNKLLEANKQKYSEETKFLTNGEMQEAVKGSYLYSQVAQTLSHRLHNALWRMIKLRKQGKECGFPRFKNIDRIKSLNYPQSGFSLDEKLKVTPFGELSIVKHRRINGKIRCMALKKEASGKWFAIFCVEQEENLPGENKGIKVGVDLGLMRFATLSDGAVIKNPLHLKKHEDKLALIQKRLSEKKKGSFNRKKARIHVARVFEKVVNTRTDFLHKASTLLVNSYSIIVLEKLSSREMAERQFGKQINDAGWGMFANMLAYKAESAGCHVVFVNPKDTTKECSNCRNLTKKELRERMHTCPFCGLSMDRDLNAARVILKRATDPKGRAMRQQAHSTAGTAGSNASGDVAVAMSMKEDAACFNR
ncbi:transposase [Candidatus Micrarchaeota archaeon CG08_land_8_20_14_0_20_49_17]|nr:MAG: transposase [Candidatus Micrarchaeota archaeon CG08_land_8_20_14_0_20_49_17]PIZ93124.1 MAG: transposase [Candidatus Micrarchaeota archaeon CG_4_10_14_0_2_um_filter_49_7]